MPELKATTKSLGEAKKALDSHLRKFSFYRDAVAGAIDAALDALFVPREAGEAWVVDPMCGVGSRYIKHPYSLVRFDGIDWTLFWGKNPIKSLCPATFPVSKAQAWANETIREREAEKYDPVPPPKPAPKPIGPARFKLPNGDEVRIIMATNCQFFVLHEATDLLIKVSGTHAHKGFLAARQALEAAGAERIPEAT